MYETNRLILKVIDESYSREVLKYYIRNKEFLKPWEIERRDMFFTLKFQKIQLHKDFLDIEKGKLLRFWIFKKTNAKQIIGNVSINNIDEYSCFLGYKLDKNEINNGFATEAVNKTIEIIRNEYKNIKIIASIKKENIASLRILYKLKFLYDGNDDEHIKMVLKND